MTDTHMAPQELAEHRVRVSTRTWTAVSLCIAVGAGAALILLLDDPLMRDEIWHWPALILFGGGLPTLEVLASYHSGPAPLSYVLWGNLYALGLGLPVLRMTSLVCLAVAVLGIARIARQLGAGSLFVLLAFMLVQPYILTDAFLLMTDCLGLALAVWALYWVLVAMASGRNAHWLWAGLLMTVLLYTRIPYLSLPLGLGLAAVIDRRRRWQALPTAALGVVALGPLIALWGGVSPLTMQGVHHPTVDPRHLNHLVAWLGFFYWPYLLTRRRLAAGKPAFLWLLPLIAVGALATWFMPFDDYDTRSAGVVDNLLITTGEVGPSWLPHVLYGVCWLVGLGVVAHIAFQAWQAPTRRAVLLMAICGAGLPVLHPYWWERHAVPVYLFLGLLAWSETMERRWIPLAWLSLLATLAIAHLVHVVVYLG